MRFSLNPYSILLTSKKPIVRVRYGVGEQTLKELEVIVEEFVKKHL
jgi:hypothetical protein